MRYLICVLTLAITSAANAAPPPPPPEYVYEAGKLLASGQPQDSRQIAPLFADDVSVFQNGKPIENGRADWLKWWASSMAKYDGHVLGFSEASAGYGDDGGDLLVIDTFDTVDRSDLPPTFVADPRMATRSILYQFGSDHLIHFVRIAVARGFWMQPGI